MRSTGLAMIGARTGDRVIFLGAPGPADATLAAEVAAATGLSGRTLVVDVGPEPRARVEAAGAKAGALVEFEWAPVTMLPLEGGAFDIAVVCRQLSGLEGHNRVACCQEALRMLAPKGRVVVVEGQRRPGLFGLLPSKVPGLPAADVTDALKTAGARAVRTLADIDGVAYYEAK
jgi:ubiquinone/menaquinone biosynthesis C-methylase UbiE